MPSAIPYSPRDLESLRQQLVRGNVEAKKAAIKELTAAGHAAQPLAGVIAEEFRKGLLVPSWEGVSLLEAVPDPTLYDALVVSGTLSSPNLHDKCRLFVLGLVDFENDLCTYVYQRWNTNDDSFVPYAIEALGARGTSEARDTLRAVEPDLAEWANATRRDIGSSPLIDHWTGQLAGERLIKLQEALAAIESRLATRQSDAQNSP